MEQPKALLVGNGINRVFQDQELSWNALLLELARALGGKIDLSNPLTPLPLAFESLLKIKDKEYLVSMRDAKEEIARLYRMGLISKEPHQWIASNNAYDHIMTTNYEYTIEQAIKPGFSPINLELISTNEENNSLLRKYEFPSVDAKSRKTVWHIHGEIEHAKHKNPKVIKPSNSILIGYNQYIAYQKAVLDYFYVSKNTRYTRYTRLIDKLGSYKDNATPTIESWIDLFFFEDIDIVGLTLDFSELHLWWILNRRFALQRDGKVRDVFRNTDRHLPEPENTTISNTIRYFYPRLANRICHYKCPLLIESVKLNSVLSMLNIMGVETVPIDCDSYEQFYEKVLKP